MNRASSSSASLPSNLTLQAFALGDLPALQEIRRAAFEPVFQSFRQLVGEEIAAIAFAQADVEQAKLLGDICAAGTHHHVWVAREGAKEGAKEGAREERIVGFVTFTVDAAQRLGELGLNAVHPRHAGRGIGEWMYRAALSQMKALGAAVAAVGTGGDPSHAPARRAYEKVGFGAPVPSVYLYKLL